MDGEEQAWSQEPLPDGWRVNRTLHFAQDGRYLLNASASASTTNDHRTTVSSLIVEARVGRFGHLVSDETILPGVMNHTQEGVRFSAIIRTSFQPQWAEAYLVLSDGLLLTATQANIEPASQDAEGYTTHLTGWMDYAPNGWGTPEIRRSHSGTYRLDMTYVLGSGGPDSPVFVGGNGREVRILEQRTEGPPPAVMDSGPEPQPQPRMAPPVAPAGAVAAVGVVVLLITEWGRYALLRFPLAGVAGRITGADVLAHRRRSRLHEAIRAEPGVGYGELRRHFGWSNGVLSHHLHVLERAGHIRVSRRGTRLHFRDPASARPPLPATQRTILARLEAGWTGSQAALAADLGVSRQAVHAHVRDLVAAGLVRVRHDGSRTRLEARPTAGPPPG